MKLAEAGGKLSHVVHHVSAAKRKRLFVKAKRQDLTLEGF
jgi:hypothetical protein